MSLNNISDHNVIVKARTRGIYSIYCTKPDGRRPEDECAIDPECSRFNCYLYPVAI